MGKKQLTTQGWIEKAKKTHGEVYDYSKVSYSKYGCKVVIGCPKHGEFVQTEYNHRNGAGCPKCGVDSRSSQRAYSFDSFVVRANQIHNSAYEYDRQEIKNNRSKVNILCREHGYFTQKVGTHLNGSGCRKCGYAKNGKRAQLGISEFLRRATELHGDAYEYLSGLSGMHRNMLISCKVHGGFKQTPHNHLKGAGCPKCNSKVSKGEQEVFQFIKEICLDAKQSVRGVIGRKELDVFVPSKNIAVEFNGLWFHRHGLVGDKHREKWETCANRGIKLIQIFEDEWADKKEIVKSRLRVLLGGGRRTFARKCRIIKPSLKETRTFLENSHLQGAGNTLKYAYALECDGELVALATFGKPRFSKETDWELLRYASTGRVVGGISKIIRAFQRDNPGQSIVSYADLRWGDGEAYGKVGFMLQKITEPDYWWADCAKTVRIPRYKLQPHKTGLPEKEYAEKNGLVKIYGVGHKKWILANISD